MKLIIRIVLLISLTSLTALTVLPQKVPPVRIEGTYENLTVGKESGDLVGMRVMLIDGGGGIYAIVQEAGGGVELPDPATAKVDVNGAKISFTIKLAGRDEEEKFSGTVSNTGLRLQRTGEKPVVLKRKRC